MCSRSQYVYLIPLLDPDPDPRNSNQYLHNRVELLRAAGSWRLPGTQQMFGVLGLIFFYLFISTFFPLLQAHAHAEYFFILTKIDIVYTRFYQI